jgi:WD40 repeat protein
MEADESVVVFCPSCRAECDQAVLKSCKRCQHDFLKAVDLGELWRPLGAVAMPAAAGTKLTEFVLDEEPTALAFLPDGRLLTASKDRSIQLWQVGDTDTEPHRVWAHALTGLIAKPVIALSRDGALAAVARKGFSQVKLLRTATGDEIAQFPAPAGVTGIAFRPDDQALAICAGTPVALNLSGQKIATYAMGMLAAPTFVLYSPDGAFVAADSWASVFIFDATSAAKLNKIPLGDTARALAWSARRDLLGVAIGAVARLIEVPGGATVAEFRLDAKVTAIAFSIDARYLAVASDDRSARVFDLITQAESARISRPCPVTAVAFGPDGTLAIGDESRTVQFWSPPREYRDLAVEGRADVG